MLGYDFDDHNDDDDDTQDDCDDDKVKNMEDICPCDPTKSVTDLHGLVPHEVCIEMTLVMMMAKILMLVWMLMPF